MKSKRLLISALISIQAIPAFAMVPCVDAPNLVESVASNIQDAIHWAEEQSLDMVGMDLESMLSKMGIDNNNNAMANLIVRTGAATQEVQNLELAEQLEPDSDICRNVTDSYYLKEIICHIQDETNRQVEEKIRRHTDFSSAPIDQNDKIKESIDTLLEECATLTHDGAQAEEGDNPISNSLCLSAGMLWGHGMDGIANENQRRATEKAIQLLTGPVPAKKESAYLPPGAQKNQVMLMEMRKEAARSVAITSLTEISAWQIGPKQADGTLSPSKMMQFQKRVDDRNDPVWLAEVAGGKLNGDEEADPIHRTELLRKMTAMDAIGLEMQMEQLKQSMRQEAVLATMLSIMVDP